MPWAEVITDEPGACMGSQAWEKRDVTRLHAKREVQVKCNTSMHQAITKVYFELFNEYQTKHAWLHPKEMGVNSEKQLHFQVSFFFYWERQECYHVPWRTARDATIFVALMKTI